jgi:hypothetical protein
VYIYKCEFMNCQFYEVIFQLMINLIFYETNRKNLIFNLFFHLCFFLFLSCFLFEVLQKKRKDIYNICFHSFIFVLSSFPNRILLHCAELNREISS